MNASIETIEQLGRRLWGDPNRRLSTKREIRFGTNGSKAVNLQDRIWFDHETGDGGGWIDLYRLVHGGQTSEFSRRRENLKPAQPPKPTSRIEWREVKRYIYRDETGEPLYCAVRYEPKRFVQWRFLGWQDDRPRWDRRQNCMDGVRRVPYRLPELLASASYAIVFICEGEKDADNVASHGLIATTNVGGANNWQPEISEHFRGRQVVILPDNDEAGEQRVIDVAEKLDGIARTVRVLRLPDLPPKGDVSDYLEAGGTAEELEQMTAFHTPEETQAWLKVITRWLAAEKVMEETIPWDAPLDVAVKAMLEAWLREAPL
jgi:hypothetical protein